MVSLLKLLVTVGGIGWVGSHIYSELQTSPQSAQQLFGAVRMELLIAALLLTAVSMWLSSLQWRFLLRVQGVLLSVKEAARLYFVGLFFNTFMPGNIGGDAKKIYDLYRQEGELSTGFTATFFDRLFGLFILTLIGVCAGIIFVQQGRGGDHFLLSSFWILLGMGVGFAVLFSGRASQLLVSLLQMAKLQRIGAKLETVRSCFHLYRKGALLWKVLIFSVLIQSSRIAVHWMLARAIGLDAPLVAFFFFVPLLGVVSALPISIGGFGPRELIAQSLFALVAFSPVEAFVLTELSVLVVIAVSLPGGISFLLSSRTKSNERSSG